MTTTKREAGARRAGRTAQDAAFDSLSSAPSSMLQAAASIASVYAVDAYLAGYDDALAEHRIPLVAAALTGGHAPADAVRIADETIAAMKEAT